MRIITTVIAGAVLALSLSIGASPSWAIFETKAELASMAQITMDKAVEIALRKIPGKAVEAEIEKEDGRAVYEIEIIDTTNTKRKVHVDARTGDVVKAKKD